MWTIDQQQAWRGAPDSDTYYSFYVGRLPSPEEEPYYDGDWANVLGAIDLIENYAADQPLCIYLPLTYPHPPYAVEEPWYSMIDRAALPARLPAPEGWRGKPSLLKGIWERQRLQGWSEERWTELRATYYGMCARVDHQFGLLVEALRRAGLYDDTAIFFFTDHGDFTGDYGLVEKTQNTFEDCLSRVPFIVKPPAWAPVRPRVSDALVELIDFPGHGRGAGRDHPAAHALRPLAACRCWRGRRRRIATPSSARAAACTASATPWSWRAPIPRCPRGLYWPRVNLQTSEGPEHTKAVMCRTHDYKYVRRLYEQDELYDLRADPGELHNRIDDPALAGVLAGLKERMLTFFLETGDVVPHDTDRRR